MMDSGNGSKEMPAGSLCRNGCGFYGSAATEGMCSKCYKDYLRKKQSSPVQAATALATPSHPVTVSTNLSADPSPIVTSDTANTASSLSSSTATTTGATTISNAANERVQPPIEEEGATAKTPETTSQSDDSSHDSCPSPATSGDSPDGSEKGKKKKNRCTTCRKKVGLTGFECRCGGLFCSIHRYSDKHECSFDYRSHGQEEIRKNNPIVVGEKIKKL